MTKEKENDNYCNLDIVHNYKDIRISSRRETEI